MKIYRKKPNFIIFGSILLFIILFLNILTLMLAAVIFYKQAPSPLAGNNFLKANFSNKADVGRKFADCAFLSDLCLNSDCQYYYLCNDYNKAKNCTVYDCGSGYGIVVEKEDGSFASKEYAKPDKEQIYALVDRCAGKITIKSKKCVQEKYEIDLGVETKGECAIKGFMVDTGNKNYTAPVFEKNGDNYRLTLDKCGEVAEIIAVGEGGISIK